ncbi:MAG: NAD-dependent epimerase/dehydratase family protein [Anaerolineaceae bacterium]|nr:NAD-dependent epimerase/dehydratase family protein [Anaerolineaceae bacterium]
MKIVVSGSAGLVGSNIVCTLLNNGDAVTAMVHRDRRALEGLDVTIAAGDIEDVDSLRVVFTGADAVIHSAGHVSIRKNEWDKLQRLNVQSTCNVAQACLDAGVKKLVYISSVLALELEPLDEPLDENRSLALGGRFTPYDRSKAMAELEIQQAAKQGLHTTILRPTAVIGLHDHHPSALGKAIYYLSRGKWPAVVQGGFDWVDARDVGQAVHQTL